VAAFEAAKADALRKMEAAYRPSDRASHLHVINEISAAHDTSLRPLAMDASDREIQKTYRRLALLLHPDKNPNGEEAFKRLSDAYTRLELT